MNFFNKENFINSDEKRSPSGKYLLTINSYKTGPSSWNYTKGIITRISDNKIVAEIERNYSQFTHKFFFKNGEEWLFTGKTYMSQCFINLDKETIYDNSSESKDQFCWTDIYLSPDEKTLAVHGCYWAGPYEYQFFDCTDLSKGWPSLQCDISTYSETDKYTNWSKDNVFYFSDAYGKIYDNNTWVNPMVVYDRNGSFSKGDWFVDVPEVTIFLVRKDNKMVLVSKLKNKERREKDNESKEFWKEKELNNINEPNVTLPPDYA